MPALIAALEDTDPSVQQAAAAVLGQLGPSVTATLQAELHHQDPDRRRHAAYLLGQISQAHADERLWQAEADCCFIASAEPIGFPNKSLTLPVFFATNRAFGSSAEPAYFFGEDRNSEVTYGIAKVSLPLDHRMGELESPSFWHLWRYGSSPDPNKHVVLLSVQPLEETVFRQKMVDALHQVGKDEEREILVFVHGYRVTFEDAARRTAQLAYDLNFQGIPAMFSWPSKGRLAKYAADEATIEWAADDLKSFLVDLTQISQARGITVIAHSMGSRALFDVMVELAAMRTAEKEPIFENIILAAPDIDRGSFIRRSKVIKDQSKILTLYASSNDKALALSRGIHDYPRAGESG